MAIRCGAQITQWVQEAEYGFAHPKSAYPTLEDGWSLLKEFCEPTSILPPYFIAALQNHHQRHTIKGYQPQSSQSEEMPESLYTNLYIVEKSSIRLRDRSTEDIPLFTLGRRAPDFKQWFDEKRVAKQHVLLEGEAGIGKTTLAEHLAFLHAQNQLWSGQFEAILIVPLRLLVRLVQSEKTLSQVISETVTYLPEPVYAIEIALLKRAIENRQILLVLDGADEVPTENLVPPLSTIYNGLLACPRQVTTTRPYRLSSSLKALGNQYRIMGFTAQLARQYVDKFFKMNVKEEKYEKGVEEDKKNHQAVGKKSTESKILVEDDSEIKITKPTLGSLKDIQKNPIWDKISRSPLLLSFCCSLIAAKTQITVADMRMTELYQGIFNILIYRFLQRNLREFDTTIPVDEILQDPFTRGPVEILEKLALETSISHVPDISTGLLEKVLAECGYSRKLAQTVLRIELLKPTTEDKTGISGCYFAHADFTRFLHCS